MNAHKTEIYVSTDIEADGPIPGLHSMLSIGSAAYQADKTLVSTFSANLETLPEATPHPRTTDWWKQFPQAWDACRESPRPPQEVMSEYVTWVQSLPGKPVFVAWPSSWDFMWVYWYLIRYTDERPFSESALDIKSYAMAMRKSEFCKTGKHYLPKRWFDEFPHTHIALDDALEQGALFCNMLSENV